MREHKLRDGCAKIRFLLRLCLIVTVCLSYGCEHKVEDQTGGLLSIQPNEAQRKRREENRQKRVVAKVEKAVHRSRSLVVLQDVLRDFGSRLTQEEWEAVETVDACYASLWRQTDAERNRLLTEQQKEVQRIVREENETFKIGGDTARNIEEDCLCYTVEQESRLSTLRSLRKSIQREATGVLRNLIRPEMIAGASGTLNGQVVFPKGDAVVDDIRTLAEISERDQYVREELLESSFPQDRLARMSAAFEVANNVQLGRLVPNGLPDSSADESVAPANDRVMAIMNRLLNGISLTESQEDGVALILQQVSEQSGLKPSGASDKEVRHRLLKSLKQVLTPDQYQAID